MDILLRRLIPFSMLTVNLITTHFCLSKKKNVIKTILFLTVYTGLMVIVSLFIRQRLNQQFLQWGLLLLIGATYYFPIKYLYQEKSRNVIAVMLFSWIHTLSVTFFAVFFSTNYFSNNVGGFAFLVQNSIFIFSTPYIIRFIKTKFIYILDNIPKKMYIYLLALSTIEFFLLIITYLLLARDNNPIWILTIGVGLALIAIIVFGLIYMIVKNQNEISNLEDVVFIDDLTKLKNRTALFNNLNELVNIGSKFRLIYMDLDNFKFINDRYGHFEGDEYLKRFAKIIEGFVNEDGLAYRISGDEFIIIFTNMSVEIDEDKVKEYIEKHEFNQNFLGVSIGFSKFPEDSNDVDNLIRIADESMYKDKKVKEKLH